MGQGHGHQGAEDPADQAEGLAAAAIRRSHPTQQSHLTAAATWDIQPLHQFRLRPTFHLPPIPGSGVGEMCREVHFSPSESIQTARNPDTGPLLGQGVMPANTSPDTGPLLGPRSKGQHLVMNEMGGGFTGHGPPQPETALRPTFSNRERGPRCAHERRRWMPNLADGVRARRLPSTAAQPGPRPSGQQNSRTPSVDHARRGRLTRRVRLSGSVRPP